MINKELGLATKVRNIGHTIRHNSNCERQYETERKMNENTNIKINVNEFKKMIKMKNTRHNELEQNRFQRDLNNHVSNVCDV